MEGYPLDKIQQNFIKIRKLLDITFFRVLFFLTLGVLLYIAMFSNVRPEKLDISLFKVAEKTIRSPGTVEDKLSTEKKRKEALDQVQDVLILKKEYTQNRVDLITSIFESASEVNEDIKDEMQKKAAEGGEASSRPLESVPSEKAARLKEKLTEGVTKDIPEEVFLSLMQASKEDLAIAKDLTVTAINNIMSKRISADDVENAKKRVEEELKYTTLDEPLKNSAIELGRYAIVQNEFYDPDATEELRNQAAENVEPVKILQGQIIVEEGELITREKYRQLKLAGFLNNDQSLKPYIGLAFLIGLILCFIYYYFYQLKTEPDKRQTFLLLFGLIFTLSIFLMKMVSLLHELNYTEISYIFPAAMCGMLIKILMDEKLAVFISIIMAICGSIIFNEGISGALNISAGIYILFSSLAGILFLSTQNQRSKILQAGFFASAVNLITLLSLMFLRNGQYSGMEYVFFIIASLVSGVVSAVLCIGFLPFFEASFGILSTMKLIELSNPNHPLLRKILTEAPGTYHHSVMVANLAESACEAIGANGLLARVGCYYHDVGKTKRPLFFIENQLNRDNPHDRLPPEKSAQIIIAHATDGGAILRKYHMPKEIVEIAEQHHGTSLLKFFYHKAVQVNPDIKEKEYRYPGPKAQTKEIAIIGIADSVEAAVRSMTQPTPVQIESLVRAITADKLQDGQFNECELTLKELEVVAHTLCETLKGIFHSRIEYPEITKQKVIEA